MSAVDRRGFIRTAGAGLGASLGMVVPASAQTSHATAERVYDVHAFGAKGDGVMLDRRAIQMAID